MQTGEIQIAITAMCSIYLFFEIGLHILNALHVSKASSVPPHFQDFFDSETFKKAKLYTLAKSRFAVVEKIFSVALLILLANSSVLGEVDLWLRNKDFSMLVTGVTFIILLMLATTVLGIPFQLYHTFVLEERFGFNKMTLGMWLIDFFKSIVLSMVLMIPLVSALLWFMESTGSYWWIFAWGFVCVFQVLILFVYPVYIAPIFNEFTPLPEGSLRDSLFSLAEELKFVTSGIFIMDGSRRSGHGNAYFTGFGKNKRIVLFDTLVETLPEENLVAVLAHEIGHEKLNHIKKSMALSIVILLVGLWLLSILMQWESLFFAFGFQSVSAYAALVIFSLYAGPVMFFLTPVFSVMSRAFEYQADRFAIDAVDEAQSLKKALLLLSKKSLSNLTPHPLFSFFHYSHPTLIERFAAMEKYAESRI